MSEIKKEENILVSNETDMEMSELEALLKNNTEEVSFNTESIPKESIAEKVEVKTTEHYSEEEELSPLDRMKQNAEKNNVQRGIVMNSNDITTDDPKVMRDFVHNDERMAAIDDTIHELDESIKKREAVILIKNPVTQTEFVQAMIEIDSVKFDSLGKAYVDMGTDSAGNKIVPAFIRVREEDEELFDFESVGLSKDASNKDYIDGKVESEPIKKLEKGNTVKILIDKTGLGTDFAFTDDEKAKIREADSILVNEVKVIDINSIRSKRSVMSFQEVLSEYDTSGSRTTICFPGSGFKAQMKGMSYGEYADVALSMENVTFDQYYKRLSVIYNKMVNISTGSFDSFEDFLKNIAYTDIQMALYGLFISTESDNQDIQLRCGNERCNQLFNWNYDTRSVLRLERCADVFLDKMKEIATADAADYDKIKANSAVQNSKFLEMPDTKYIVEMGIASAYDFLYNFIPLMNEDTFKEAFGDDINEIYMNNILLLTSVRSVRVPDGKGGYVECYGYKDILDAIYHLTPGEAKILAAYTARIQADYELTFSLGRVVCPHCGNVTAAMDVNMDDLVFQTYQRLMSTEVDLKNILDF